jgi:hypothetical protein
MFNQLKKELQKHYKTMLATKNQYFAVDIDRDKIWETYINSFADNPEEMQGHNCNCCKAFLRQIGGMVVIKNGKKITLWDFDESVLPEMYQKTVQDLRAYVSNCKINGLLYVKDGEYGKDNNFSLKHGVVFEHFSLPLSKSVFNHSNVSQSGALRSGVSVLERGMTELKQEAIETVLELINQNSLYRGQESKSNVDAYLKLYKEYKDAKPEDREILLWKTAIEKPIIASLKNTSIGNLLVSISEGEELEKAVNAFERMVAPSNYKRPTALATPEMIKQAKEKLSELGLLSALERRKLDTRDLGPHNALYVHRGTEATKDVFATLAAEAPVKVQTFDKCEEVTIEKFQKDILPTCKNVRLLVENRHLNNFVTLTGAVDPEAKHLFAHKNSFGWSYTGGVADSMREKVVALGGRVDGAFRFTHSWNWDDNKPNRSLMDLHVFMPECKVITKSGPTCSGRRVGWNLREDKTSGGVQDVDYVDAAPAGKVPVENITFPSIAKMPEGVYRCAIHNWQLREPTKSGFRAEIEFGGEVFEYQYDKALKNKEWIDVAEVTLKNGKFTIDHKIPTSTGSREKWGISTNQWRTVKSITLSPNHWDEPKGNKHWFFMLEGCISDEATRPFYNEFLCQELQENRKVMELLASKITVADAEGMELSGLGFSETVRNHCYLEIEGAFKRVIKVTF